MRMMTHGKAAANRALRRIFSATAPVELRSLVLLASCKQGVRALRSHASPTRPHHDLRFTKAANSGDTTLAAPRLKGVAAAVGHGTWFAKTYAGVRQS
jgi:hypothetical protein